MNLSVFLRYRSVPARKQVAEAAGVSYRHLLNVARGDVPCGYALCIALEAATGYAVSRHDLRPDLFSKRGCECHTCTHPTEGADHATQGGHVKQDATGKHQGDDPRRP